MKASKAFVIYKICLITLKYQLFFNNFQSYKYAFKLKCIEIDCFILKTQNFNKELLKKYFNFISNYLAKIFMQLLK